MNGRTQTPRITYVNDFTRNQRSGWCTNTSSRVAAEAWNVDPCAAMIAIICHLCYTHGHTSLQCLCCIPDLPEIVANYEALTPQQKAFVPAASYLPAKTDSSFAVPTAPFCQAPPAKPRKRTMDSSPTQAVNRGQNGRTVLVEEPEQPAQESPAQGN